MNWCHFNYLAQKWEKEGNVPKIPAICRRPLIITSSELEKVQNIKNEQEEKLNGSDTEHTSEIINFIDIDVKIDKNRTENI